MQSPFDDQINAARHEARAVTERMLGTAQTDHDEVMHGFMNRLLDAVLEQKTGGCKHAGSPQPMFASVWERYWRCRPCFIAHAKMVSALGGEGLSEVEEHTCDLCHKYVPKQLAMLHMRVDIFFVYAGMCDDCASFMRQHGAVDKGTTP